MLFFIFYELIINFDNICIIKKSKGAFIIYNYKISKIAKLKTQTNFSANEMLKSFDRILLAPT